MSIFRVIFGGGFADGARRLSSKEVEAMIRAKVPTDLDTKLNLADESYLALEEGRLSDLIAKTVRTPSIRYHREFPDCDDFAEIAKAQVLLGAINARLDLAPCFFVVVYECQTGKLHAANITLDASGDVCLYEPQAGEFKPLSDIEYVVRVG